MAKTLEEREAEEEAGVAGMKHKLECVQDEKAANKGAILGMFALPFCIWGLYSLMQPTGELDDAAKLCYVLKSIGPTVFMQWFLFETMAKIRIAKVKAGKCPHPWEPDGRLGGGKPTPEGIDALNPSFYALWVRVCQNNFESTVLNTFSILCLSLYCGGKMYDCRLPVALGYMHAIGGLIYAYAYAFVGPNHRMWGFIIRGFWQNGATALFCIIRSFGFFAEKPVMLFWGCSVGLVLIVCILIKIVKQKFHLSIPEGQVFGYKFEEFQAWSPKDFEAREGYNLM
eukprot:TRINITY_DN94444_c0_g1_i1.p1 TRINITY_DN94444_c0_g1~~TRINITY_DN94444_c0_g1_i1.p1  ORF type:complete len:284 (-),score=47.55 TRINITY_DN94444_c0_g1_i1:36-887(-)